MRGAAGSRPAAASSTACRARRSPGAGAQGMGTAHGPMRPPRQDTSPICNPKPPCAVAQLLRWRAASPGPAPAAGRGRWRPACRARQRWPPGGWPAARARTGTASPPRKRSGRPCPQCPAPPRPAAARRRGRAPASAAWRAARRRLRAARAPLSSHWLPDGSHVNGRGCVGTKHPPQRAADAAPAPRRPPATDYAAAQRDNTMHQDAKARAALASAAWPLASGGGGGGRAASTPIAAMRSAASNW